MRGFTLFYIFATLFNVWLNRKWLYSLICFWIQSGAICHISEIYEKSLATHRCADEN